MHEQTHNPHYLKGPVAASGGPNYGGASGGAGPEVGDVPVQQLDLNVPLRIGGERLNGLTGSEFANAHSSALCKQVSS